MKKPFTVFVAVLLCVGIISSVLIFHKKPVEPAIREGSRGRLSGAEKQLASWFFAKGYPEPEHLDRKYAEAWAQFQALKNPELRTTGAGSSGSTEILNGANWTALGPKVIGGRVLSIAISPANANHLFIGTASGGIWKTTTGGVGAAAWTNVPTGFQTLGVSSIVFHPSNANILLAGTGEVYNVNNANTSRIVWKTRGTYGVGILKSINGGTSWTQVLMRDLPNLFAIQRIVYDPNNSNIVYAAATDGLYKSVDGGSSWSKLYDKVYVRDVVVQIGNSNNIVISVGNVTNTDKGIYRTTNGGTSWSKISSGLPASFLGMIEFAYNSGTTLYAGIGGAGGSDANSNLYVSGDFGATWAVKSGSNYNSYQYWFANALAIDPTNSNQLILGGVNLHRYLVGTSARTQINSTADKTTYMMPGDQEGAAANYVHSDIHDIEFVPASSTFYVACDGGMFRSTDGGSTFSSLNGGLQISQFYPSVSQSNTDQNFFIGGLQDNNTAVFNGTGWKRFFVGDGGSTAIHPTDHNIVYFSQDARRIGKSTNKASSYLTSTPANASGYVLGKGLSAPLDDRAAFIAPIAISKSNPSVLYVGSDNIHRTSDAGTTWTNVGSATVHSVPTNYIDARNKPAMAIAVSPTNANKFYVSTSPIAQFASDNDNIHFNPPARLFRSTNGNLAVPTFTDISSGLPDRFTLDIAISPTNDDSVFITMGGFGTPHVYVTGNGGSTWTARSAGLPDVPFNCIIFDENNPNFLYAGCDLGVYVSPNRGQTWYDFNAGMSDATLIMDLVITPANKLRAATHGKGILESNLAIATLPLQIKDFSGKAMNDYNLLKWTTFSEENVAKIELQRSEDGTSFHAIASFEPVNKPGLNNYSHNDRNIRDIQDAYYKLKIIDKDGQYKYSNVVLLRPVIQNEYRVIAEPGANSLGILVKAYESTRLSVSIADVSGKTLYKATYDINSGHQRLSIDRYAAFPKGMYVVQIRNSNNDVYSTKVIK